MINEIKENDLLLVKKSFYYTNVDPGFGKVNYNHEKVKKGNILLVLENNFGATYKERFTICLLSNRKVYINSRGLNSALHNLNDLSDCFDLLNRKL